MKNFALRRLTAGVLLAFVGLTTGGCILSKGDDTSGRLALFFFALPYLPRGELDATFAGPGFTVYAPSGGNTVNENAGGIAFDPAGNIYVAGPRDSGDGSPQGAADMALWRYSPEGVLDPSWGGAGFVAHKNAGAGNGNDIANDMVRDSQGRFVVVGSTVENGSGHTDFIVWRFNGDGTLDTSFNAVGFNSFGQIGNNGQADSLLAVTLDSAGRIIAAGSVNGVLSSTDMVVMRFTTDGALDTSFGGTGYLIHTNAAGGVGNDVGQNVIVDELDRPLIVGRSENGSGDQDLAVWRLDASGQLDTTFGTGGFVVHRGAAGGTNGTDSGTGLVLADNRIVVSGGSVNSAADFDMVLWAFTRDGVLDTTFGTSGGFTVVGDPLAAGFDNANAVTRDAYGNIIVSGSANNASGNTDMIVRRFSAQGIPDGTFGNGGLFTHDNAAGGNQTDFGNRVLMDGLGRILVGGASADINPIRRMTLWRIR